jgi:methionine synthase I (cobalamin-dependent)
MTEQIEALADAGVAALVVETMSDLAEAKVALVAAKRTGLPVIVCMVFDSGRELDRTMMGVTATQAAEQLTDAGADGIGANCGQSIDSYVDLCRQLNAATSLPIWIKPNAGVPRIEGDETIYGATAEEFAKHASRLFEAGASFLGGCCGTSPEFVTALSGQIR